MKVKICFDVEHTVAPTLIALATTLSDEDNAECIDETLGGVDWALQACVEQSSEISESGRASLIQARQTIDRLLEAIDYFGK